jgi:hypothetical protein
MRGVRFLVNDDGGKRAVLLDFQKWRKLGEDFYDILVSRSRVEEDTVSWNALETELDQENSTHGAVRG